MFSIKFDKLSSIGANRCHYCTREMFMWLSGKVNKFSVCTIERKMSEVAVNTCVRLGGKHLWHLSLCNFFLFKKIACVFRVNSAQLSPPNTCVCVSVILRISNIPLSLSSSNRSRCPGCNWISSESEELLFDRRYDFGMNFSFLQQTHKKSNLVEKINK